MKLRVAVVLLAAFCVVCFATTRRITPSLTTDWARRVVANGGAMPSQNSIRAMENMRVRLIAMGVTNKIYSLCRFVPDSTIAMATPLFYHKGYPLWTNNFVIGDLNINGLKGDGTSKFMDTGVKAKAGELARAASFTKGLSVIITESATNQNAIVMGQQEADTEPLVVLQISSLGISGAVVGDLTAPHLVTTQDWARVGFTSMSFATNETTTNISFYVASPTESFKSLTNKAAFLDSGDNTSTEQTVFVFANDVGGTAATFYGGRMSAAVAHDGLTPTETSNLWVALRICGDEIGGGTGDKVHDYSQRVVNFGGAAISVTSSNGLRVFHGRMDEYGLLYRISAANTYRPDNLTAVRLPFLWQAGNMIWTNVAFAASNLTINGLTGNLTNKYLGTGLNPAAITYGGFGSASAGMSVLVFNVPASASLHDFSSSGTAANSLLSMANNSGILNFYCWKFVTVNTEFLAIAAPSPGGTWAGYLSGNRTAANAIRLDWVTNGVHNIATNGTGSQTGSTATMTNMYAHANSSPGLVPTTFSDHTISFIALHPGLTQTQSSNLWEAVKELRTADGGGVPP